jgi:hypothetical protein
VFGDGQQIVLFGTFIGHMRNNKCLVKRCQLAQTRKIFTPIKINNCLAMGLISYNHKRFRVYTPNLKYTNMLQNLICKVSTLDVKWTNIGDCFKEHENFIIFFTLHSYQKYLCQTTN